MKFRIVVVMARPSGNTVEFFNSIKFHTYEVEHRNRDDALGDYSPNTSGKPETAVDLSDGYEVLNWYAFEEGDGWRS